MTTTPILIHLAESDSDILACLPVLRELRPNLLRETFLATIRRMQGNGYFLAMLESKRKVRAVTGYRFSEHLSRGSFLYVDDFVTASDQMRKGYGQKLFAWLLKTAEAARCREMHLDSGVHRTGAHLFYEKQQMTFASRHYAIRLKVT